MSLRAPISTKHRSRAQPISNTGGQSVAGLSARAANCSARRRARSIHRVAKARTRSTLSQKSIIVPNRTSGSVPPRGIENRNRLSRCAPKPSTNFSSEIWSRRGMRFATLAAPRPRLLWSEKPSAAFARCSKFATHMAYDPKPNRQIAARRPRQRRSPARARALKGNSGLGRG
jgi:hypothetical protein